MKRRLAAWRHELAYLHDVIMCTAAFAFAFYLRLGDAVFGAYYGPVLLEALAVVAAIAAVVLRFFGLYRGVWAYASVRDLMELTKAISAVVLISVVVLFAVTRLGAIPRSVPAIHWFVAIIVLGGIRFGGRDYAGAVHAVHGSTGAEMFARSLPASWAFTQPGPAGGWLVTGFGGPDFGGGPRLHHGGFDAFAVSYDASGAHRWSNLFGSTANEIGMSITSDGADGAWMT